MRIDLVQRGAARRDQRRGVLHAACRRAICSRASAHEAPDVVVGDAASTSGGVISSIS